jgi:hypothetical protein
MHLVRRLYSAGIAGVAAAAVLAVGSGAMLDMHQGVGGSGRYAGPSICEHDSGSLAVVPGQPDTVRLSYELPDGRTSTAVLDMHKDKYRLQGYKELEATGQHLDVHYCWNEVK